MLRVLDLFSGIGGFSLGLERTGGFRTVAFCEIEPYCRSVLEKRWPGVPIYGDIKSFAGIECDVICGGFPCQPFSLAGNRMGSEDDRHLWPEYFRLIQALRPTWVIGENVAGLINLGLDAVLDDLEGAGYSARTFDIPACGVGAPHRRQRIWIVAHSNGSGRSRQDVLGKQPGGAETIRSGEDMANPSIQHEQRKLASGPDAALWGIQGERSTGPCSNGQGWWESEPSVGRVAHGVPSRVDRLRALGNAVVPQIPEIIGRAILQAEGIQ